MTRSNDDGREMPSPRLTPEAIERLMTGDVPDEQSPFARFARSVRAVEDAPPPTPSAELVTLLGGTGTGAPNGPHTASTPRRAEAPTTTGLTPTTKVFLGVVLAIAALIVAGVTGILPDPVTDAVRRFIEVLTPFDFDADDVNGTEDDPSPKPELPTSTTSSSNVLPTTTDPVPATTTIPTTAPPTPTRTTDPSLPPRPGPTAPPPPTTPRGPQPTPPDIQPRPTAPPRPTPTPSRPPDPIPMTVPPTTVPPSTVPPSSTVPSTTPSTNSPFDVSSSAAKADSPAAAEAPTRAR